MPKSLIITEKPSVARDIATSLGGFKDQDGYLESHDYVMAWAVGHILELQEPEDIDQSYKAWLLKDLPIIPHPFELKARSENKKLLDTIKKLMSRPDVQEVINACDAGREGELIFREIVRFHECQKPTRRLWLQSMTPAAIKKGFTGLRPGTDYDNLGAAAQSRSEADWLIGINATRALTRRMRMGMDSAPWSAGRVQTPTLAMIVDRELEIYAHRPVPFWRLRAQFGARDHEYEGTWFEAKFKSDGDAPSKDDWIMDEARLEAIRQAVEGKPGVASETRKPSPEQAPPLFDLTSLQRTANNRFGMSARRTLAAAQRLYETHKVLTYPRTDSRALPSDYRGHVDQVLDMLSGERAYQQAARKLQRDGLQNQHRIFDDSAVSDHFAIIPTLEPAPPSLAGDEARIYDLVVRRFLAAFYPRALWMEVKRTTDVEGHLFRTRSRYLMEPGWYEVWGKEVQDDRSLPPLFPGTEITNGNGAVEGAPVQTLALESEADASKPPPRISEARLLSMMEHAGNPPKDDDSEVKIFFDRGLGTPATRAEIIENLVQKHYVIRSDKSLRPTAKGILLIDLLRRIEVARLASPELTGELEKHLREIEAGDRTRDRFMDEVVDYTREIVDRAKEFDYDSIFKNDSPLGTCPTCKTRQVYERMRLYACEGNEGRNSGACTFSMWKERNGRYLDRSAVSELLEKGQVGPLDGFLDKRNRSYSAILKLDPDGKLVMEGMGKPEGGDAPDLPVNPDPVAVCPFDPECRVLETPTSYQCEQKCKATHPELRQGAVLPRVLCKREITREEAAHYFATGRTELITDFISKKGRPFKAVLVQEDDGRFRFEFPPREGRRGRKPAAEGETATEPARPRAARASRSSNGRSTGSRTASSRKRSRAAEEEGLPPSGTVCPGCQRLVIQAKAHRHCMAAGAEKR